MTRIPSGEEDRSLENGVREARGRAGWSQAELARRAMLSRAAVSAIETGRVDPSTGAALSLADAFGVPVEALFRLRGGRERWAWPGAGRDRRYWAAEVGGRVLRYPAEPGVEVFGAHDGVSEASLGGAGAGDASRRPIGDARSTLVIAGCDPAVTLLSHSLARTGVRVLSFLRSSGAALELLGREAVHVAGLHLGPDLASNAARVLDVLGPGYRLVHVTNWSEGLAAAPGLGIDSVAGAVRRSLRWAVREPGSGARRCMDDILAGHAATRRASTATAATRTASAPMPGERTATSHRGVVEAIRAGWADVGVCVESVAAEAGLDFFTVRREAYDLVFREEMAEDARVTALLDVLASTSFRRVIADVPGCDVRSMGERT